MANEKSTLRQADNDVTIVGVLQEINLEEKSNANGNFISGTVSIKTGENSVHKVSTFANELIKSGEKKGEVSNSYKALKTVMEEYVSVASLMKKGMSAEEAELEATKVKVEGTEKFSNGSLRRNEYYNNGQFHSNVQINANRFSRVKSDEPYEPRATFEIEGYFSKIRREVKNDEETGRLLVSLYVPLYNGVVIPLDFVADGEVADYLEDNYETKRTGFISGEIINTAVTVEKKRASFGKSVAHSTTTYVNELLITGGDEEQYDEDDKKSFDTKLIKQAVTIRDTEYLPSLKEKANNNSSSNNQGFSNKKTSPEVKKAVEAFDDDF